MRTGHAAATGIACRATSVCYERERQDSNLTGTVLETGPAPCLTPPGSPLDRPMDARRAYQECVRCFGDNRCTSYRDAPGRASRRAPGVTGRIARDISVVRRNITLRSVEAILPSVKAFTRSPGNDRPAATERGGHPAPGKGQAGAG